MPRMKGAFHMPSDIEIARTATMKPIAEIAAAAGIQAECLEPYGIYKAKLWPKSLPMREKPGKLILVTAINPTPAGEGKDHGFYRVGGRPAQNGKTSAAPYSCFRVARCSGS